MRESENKTQLETHVIFVNAHERTATVTLGCHIECFGRLSLSTLGF